MLKELSIEKENDMRKWDDFVISHPGKTPFHLSHWLKTIHETYRFRPILFTSNGNDDEISGILPCFLITNLYFRSRLVSLPFSDYGGPLCRSEEIVEKILEEIVEKYKKGINYIEIRSPAGSNNAFIAYEYYKHHVLSLSPDIDSIWKNINKRTVRYSIRKSEKAGVEIKNDNSINGITEFYRLNMMTRKKHGIPGQNIKFFKNMFSNLISKGDANILFAVHDSRAIAAGLFINLFPTVYYKYNASDPLYMSSKSPNHLLTWYAIKDAYEKGYEYFDFGRTSPNNEGLMRYKEMWGAKPIDLPYYYYPAIKGPVSQENQNLSYRIMTKVWRTMPSALSNTMGPKIIKYFG